MLLLANIVLLLPRRIWGLLRHLTNHGQGIKLEFWPVSWWWAELGVRILEIFGLGELYELSMRMKPGVRKLRPKEIEEARKVFPEQFPFHLVRVDESALIGAKTHKVCYVSFYTINAWGPISAELLLHELTHIWQYELYGAAYIPRALRAQREEGYNYGGVPRLWEVLRAGGDLRSFNLEQQGDIVADYYRIKNGRAPEWGQGSWMDGEVYAAVLQPIHASKRTLV